MTLPHEVDPFIRVYDGVFPDDLCSEVIKNFEEDTVGQRPGGTTSGYDPQVSVRSVVMLGGRMDTEVGRNRWAAIDDQIYQHLIPSWERYLTDAPTGRFMMGRSYEDSGYHIQKYDKGKGFFGPHVDSSDPTVAFRLAAAIIYLNTVAEGGGTRFPRFDLTVDCVRGRVLWFPATWTYEHEGTVPLSEDKWAISTFLCHRGHKLLGVGGPAYNAIKEAIGG